MGDKVRFIRSKNIVTFLVLENWQEFFPIGDTIIRCDCPRLLPGGGRLDGFLYLGGFLASCVGGGGGADFLGW